MYLINEKVFYPSISIVYFKKKISVKKCEISNISNISFNYEIPFLDEMHNKQDLKNLIQF